MGATLLERILLCSFRRGDFFPVCTREAFGMSLPKICFHHIPKTAGTTFNRLLDVNRPGAAILPVYDEADYTRMDALDPEALQQADIFRGHFILKDIPAFRASIPEHRFMTFLREPVPRVVSEYFWLKAWPKSHIYHHINTDDLSLEAFVRSDERRYRFRGKNLMTTWCAGVSAVDEPERALDLALEHIETVYDFVGLLERFDESLLLLKPMLQLGNILYERHNVQREEESAIPQATLDMIAEYNQLDQQLYDRAATLFAERITAQGPSFAFRLRQFQKANASFQRVSALIMQQHHPESLQGEFINGK